MERKLKKFGIVDKNVLMDQNIGLTAKALYSLMCCYADETGYCFPGISKLSDELNITQRCVSTNMKVLVNGGVIERKKRGFKKVTDTYIVDYRRTNESLI